MDDLERAATLINLKKYSQALTYLNECLATDPDNVQALAYKAIAHDHLDQPVEAVTSAEKAVGLSPNSAYTHYILAMVHFDMTKDYRLAEASLKQALRLNPQDPDFYDVYARIKLGQDRYKEAIALCDRGLSLDPENADLKSTRSRIQTLSGKKREAVADSREALKDNPENPEYFASAGWASLVNNDHESAVASFRAALRLQPDQESARAGLMQALKARKFFFRQYLKYAFWIGRWRPGVRNLITIGALFAALAISAIPGFYFVMYLYGLFALSTWLINPLFNLFLRFDRDGKHALTRGQLITADMLAGLLLLTAVSLITSLVTGFSDLNLAAAAFFTLCLPVSAFDSLRHIRRSRYRLFVAYTVLLIFFAVIGVMVLPDVEDAGQVLCGFSIFGSIGSAWVIALAGKPL